MTSYYPLILFSLLFTTNERKIRREIIIRRVSLNRIAGDISYHGPFCLCFFPKENANRKQKMEEYPDEKPVKRITSP